MVVAFGRRRNIKRQASSSVQNCGKKSKKSKGSIEDIEMTVDGVNNPLYELLTNDYKTRVDFTVNDTVPSHFQMPKRVSTTSVKTICLSSCDEDEEVNDIRPEKNMHTDSSGAVSTAKNAEGKTVDTQERGQSINRCRWLLRLGNSVMGVVTLERTAND